jgi:polyphosphate kinase 2 (PPK2 family)
MRILDSLDYDHSIPDKKTYERTLAELQLELLSAELKSRECCNPVLVLFEGWDAAGKGGAIKRLTEKLDPRGFQVWSISVPTHEEKLHHYLCRFWPKDTRARPLGDLRPLLVWARARRACRRAGTEAEWRRAYREINELERQLVDDGVVLIKLFLAITKDEQLARFKEREADPYKRWKIGSADWHNREHWNEYIEAAEEMFANTSTSVAPWTVIGANRKWHARLEVVRTVLKALRSARVE